jgi:hypothetical protein
VEESGPIPFGRFGDSHCPVPFGRFGELRRAPPHSMSRGKAPTPSGAIPIHRTAPPGGTGALDAAVAKHFIACI